MLIDTHCHLDAVEFDADRDDVAERARLAGVTGIVVPSVERANFGAVSSVCREFPLCRPAYGIHPMYVECAREEDLEALRETLRREPAVAVGEIGLDNFIEPRDEKSQSWWYAEQLKVARNCGLPVLLHVRRAVDAILKELRRVGVPGGIAHAFSGSRQQADEFIKLGFKLGFGGAMTHPRATKLRELAATLPLEAIVLETDAPDIPPEWLGRTRNEPAELPRIAAVLAELRGMDVRDVQAATSANALGVLPRLTLAAN
ncbi:MAG: TatD family hydrolase [Gammaproteobacteria bacterium]|nr:TatD family hydrolase [Gammaproteobacteria bacterium]MBU1414897.1 TatD family hydrolase [Gammaproteobacteria bacterium]